MEIIALDIATPQLRAPPSGVSYIANRPIAMTPETLTGSAATSSLSIAQTWNTTGTPTAFDLNVTDTASNASSLLMNLRLGGASRFSVGKGGAVNTFSYTATDWNSGFRLGSSYTFTQNGLNLNGAILINDAANTLAQRNGVNAQAFNIYGTFTDASNYERLKIHYDGVQFAIITENAGTGTNRPLRLAAPSQSIALDANNGVSFRNGSGGTAYWSITSAGIVSSSTGTYLQMTEMTAPAAPAADRVRIFAQDNGAGKTQLMALFATGAAQQIAIEP